MAILLVLFAVLLSAFRLFLPYAHHYKTAFEDHLNSYYQSNIAMDHIHMEWKGFGPSLVAQNVRLLKTRDTQISIATIDVRLNFFFWQSLSEQKIVAEHITLDGVDVFYDQSIVNIDNTSDEIDNEQLLADTLVDLFLNQISQFSLINSEITVNNAQQPRTFLISHLNWLNRGKRHRASGDVKIGGLSSDHLKILLDLKGRNKTQLNGQIYLQANHLNITPWLDSVFVIENEKTDSDINFDAWLTLTDGLPRSLQVQLGENQVSWQHHGIEQKMMVNQGQIVANRSRYNDGFSLSTTPLIVKINDQQWQPLNIEVNKSATSLFTYVSAIDLASSAQVMPLLVEDLNTQTMLNDMLPKGTVSDVYFSLDNNKQISLSANFSEVSTEFSQGIPGVDNFSGHVLYAQNTLKFDAHAGKGALDFDKHFIKPIPYNEINSEVLVRFGPQGVNLAVNNLTLASDELKLAGDIGVNIPKKGLAEMALLVSVKEGNAALAEHYYPHLLMGDSLVDYLNRGIIDGKVEQAQVLFNGPLAKFPFTEPEGIFVVDAELTQSTFLFDSRWPAIDNLSANLNFTNNGMLITARSGELTGLNVKGVQAAINDFGEGILTVDALIDKAQPEHITRLMLASSLKETVGATLAHVVVTQPISGHFNLNLPLQTPEQVIASGMVEFIDNDIAIQGPEMKFTGASGLLSFHNDVIRVDNIKLDWLGMPLSIDVNADQQPDFYGTNIDISALWQQAQWQQHVPDLLKKYSAGELAWQAKLALHNHRGGGFSYDLAIDSDLKQSVFKLPEPYAKPVDESELLAIKVNGHKEQSTFTANLGKQLSFYGELDHNSVQFSRSHLVLGDEQMLLPMDGFHISANLAKAQITQWQPFISDILDTITNKNSQSEKYTQQIKMLQQGSEPQYVEELETGAEQSATAEHGMLFPIPERIRGTIAELDIVGQAFTQVSFNLLDQSHWWLLQFNAKEARSQIKFYPHWLEQGVEVNADFLHLSLAEQEEELSQTRQKLPSISSADIVQNISIVDTSLNDAIMANFPPLKFHCDSCTIGKLALGEVDFSVARLEPDMLLVNQFRARRDQSELTFELNWEHNQQGSITQLMGELTIDDVEDELQKLGYASMAKESGIKSTFELNWQGAPQDYSVALLNGDISVVADDGYLTDVDDTARLFSVLSLQSLVRKLTLDFRDIFSDGMFYSSIKGDFNIKEGVLYTDNIKMNGAAGDLVMKGNTDLDLGLLDYSLSYKPNLTSSLPVLAWIATLQPAVFLAGIAIDQVMTSQVVSEFNFELTGNLDEPNFKEVNRKTMDISVGRSTPPTIVDNSETDQQLKENQPTELEQINKPKTLNKPSDKKIKTKNLYQGNSNG